MAPSAVAQALLGVCHLYQLSMRILCLCCSRRLKDNEKAIAEACKKDLGKGAFESYLTEIGWCLNDIVFVTQNLEKWAQDEGAPDIPLVNKLLSPTIRKDPLGAVLIIGYVLY